VFLLCQGRNRIIPILLDKTYNQVNSSLVEIVRVATALRLVAESVDLL
jgi:fibrillarin-like rRNA methylase